MKYTIFLRTIYLVWFFLISASGSTGFAAADSASEGESDRYHIYAVTRPTLGFQGDEENFSEKLARFRFGHSYMYLASPYFVELYHPKIVKVNKDNANESSSRPVYAFVNEVFSGDRAAKCLSQKLKGHTVIFSQIKREGFERAQRFAERWARNSADSVWRTDKNCIDFMRCAWEVATGKPFPTVDVGIIKKNEKIVVDEKDLPWDAGRSSQGSDISYFIGRKASEQSINVYKWEMRQAANISMPSLSEKVEASENQAVWNGFLLDIAKGWSVFLPDSVKLKDIESLKSIRMRIHLRSAAEVENKGFLGVGRTFKPLGEESYPRVYLAYNWMKTFIPTKEADLLSNASWSYLYGLDPKLFSVKRFGDVYEWVLDKTIDKEAESSLFSGVKDLLAKLKIVGESYATSPIVFADNEKTMILERFQLDVEGDWTSR